VQRYSLIVANNLYIIVRDKEKQTKTKIIEIMKNFNNELEVLQNKITQKINDGLNRSKQTLDLIEREGNLLTDFIAPLGGGIGSMKFHSNGHLKAIVDGKNYSINNHAISQAGTKLGIPTSYIRDLANGEKWERDLSANILNEHTDNSSRKRILVRSVGDNIRGILSDSYRRLNTGTIYSQFINSIQAEGGQIIDAFADDTRSWIDAILPEIVAIPTKNNGVSYTLFGARISNSDFGDGALSLSGYTLQAVCLNGMTSENIVRQVHLGKRLPDNINFSERTYEYDTLTQASIIGDSVSQVLGRDNILKTANSIQIASEKEIDIDKELKHLSKGNLTKDEAEGVRTILINNKHSDGVGGGSTLWKLTQGITALARDVEGRRKKDLQEIAGTLLKY
jgi:hypothetical protein